MIAYSLTNNSDIHYAVGERSGNHSQVVVDKLSEDMYKVIVYDRGGDHLPEEWSAKSHIVDIDDQSSTLPGIATVICIE